MGKISYSFAALACVLSSNQALAGAILCNKAQTKCVIEKRDVTIGDQVGVVNKHGELVATGEVKGIRGEKRAVEITKRHGAISHDYKVALLSTGPMETPQTFKIYKEPAKYFVGASLDYGIISVAGGASGFGVTPFGSMRYFDGLEFVARGTYSSYSTKMALAERTSTFEAPFEMRQMGLLGGVGYRMLESNPVSFRGELSLGMSHISATIDGDASLVDEDQNNRVKVKNGWAPTGRWSFGAYYRINKYLLSIDAIQSLTYEALASGLSFGASMDLK